MDWCVYILSCSDKTLYTGMTNDLDARLATHNRGLGAKYTRARLPVTLLKAIPCSSKSEALKIEAYIKKLRRKDKLRLISEDSDILLHIYENKL